MKVEIPKITVEELLKIYATGENNFTKVIIKDSRKGLLRDVDLSGAIVRKANFRDAV